MASQSYLFISTVKIAVCGMSHIAAYVQTNSLVVGIMLDTYRSIRADQLSGGHYACHISQHICRPTLWWALCLSHITAYMQTNSLVGIMLVTYRSIRADQLSGGHYACHISQHICRPTLRWALCLSHIAAYVQTNTLVGIMLVTYRSIYADQHSGGHYACHISQHTCRPTPWWALCLSHIAAYMQTNSLVGIMLVTYRSIHADQLSGGHYACHISQHTCRPTLWWALCLSHIAAYMQTNTLVGIMLVTYRSIYADQHSGGHYACHISQHTCRPTLWWALCLSHIAAYMQTNTLVGIMLVTYRSIHADQHSGGHYACHISQHTCRPTL